MQNITERQKSVLEFIADTIEAQGFPPTIQEIGGYFGIASTNGVFEHLKTLERKGYIKRSVKARSIQLTQKAIAGMRLQHGVTLPLVGRVAAGQPLLALENVEEYIPVPPRLARRNAFCLRVAGDSMIEAGILEGDVIVVDPRLPPKRGDIVVALIDQEDTVKYYYPASMTVELRPANRMMNSINIPPDQVNIQGVVIALQREFEVGRARVP